jgi:hypothetical protein
VVASGSLHQRKTAEIALRQSFSDIGSHLLIPQTPAKFQMHHPKMSSHSSPRTTQGVIEYLFERLQQLRLRQKLVNSVKLLALITSVWKFIPKKEKWENRDN